MHGKVLNRVVAAVLVFSTVLLTMPVSAAELTTPKASVGSVTGVGSISLRGVTLPQEGTIFSGDELQVGSSGFAKVMLVAGHRLQLDAGTKVNIQKTDKAVIVQVRSGNLGFNAATNNSQQLRIAVGPYEFVPAAGAAGNVAYVGNDTLGLRATKGNVSVQHASRPAFVVAQGQERI